MRIKALQDFSYFYNGFTVSLKIGEVLEVEDKIAKDFIERGLVEEVVEEVKNKKSKESKEGDINGIR